MEPNPDDDDDDLGSGTDDDIDAEFEYYDPGNTLYLEPYDPCEPYGVEAYPWPNNNDIEPAIVTKDMCYAQEEGSLTREVYDWKPTRKITTTPCSELTKLVVKIQDMLAGGETPGPQVLVCKVEEPSEGFPECVVVKICDPLGYNVDTNNDGTPWRETSRADIHVCCEAAALDFLDKSPLIGNRRLAPKYYGAFILKVPKINPTVGESGTREVPALVMEHIQGISLSAIRAVDDAGVLRPPTSPARWYSNGTHTLQMDEESRLEVLKIFLDGYVRQLFAGVEQRRIEPEHILIAPTEKKNEPRVALIHYRDSLIDTKHKKPLKIVSSETIMSATSASGGDKSEQHVPPTNLDETPKNPTEPSRENQPSKDSNELTDYQKRMEEYDRRHQERMDKYFGPPSDDDDEDDEDDEDAPLDPFFQKLLSPWDPETDIIDPRIHNPNDRDDPTPLPPQIETSVEFIDDYIEEDWQQAYKPGTSIVLVPHKPANPHGYGAYATPANVNPSDWGYEERFLARSRSEHALHHRPTPYTSMTEKQRRTAGLPPPFERDYSEHPTEPQASVSLKLVKFLSGRPWSGPAVFLCEVTQGARAFAMPQRVVAKFQDPMFFQASPPPNQPFYNEFDRANFNLSREAGAYEQLRKTNCHGALHLAPAYFGAFTAEIRTTNPALIGDDPFLPRSVGVILLEHIDGVSISSLCDRHGPEGALTPRRLDMLKTFIDGFVRQLFAGVYQEEAISPDHILVAPAAHGRARVAMIHYRDSLVDCKCMKPQRTYDDFPHPPHPYTIFKNAYHLSALEGWFPYMWMDKDNDELEEWLIKTFDDDAFGPYHPLKIGTSDSGGDKKAGEAV
ncbi:hypothetical protein K4K57_002958 [Colletotrichum sp. SAR 10_99]|nr:hypothetical protein K4K57_002958 [Colletotrichum sp. SAR 10_99]